MWFIRSKRTFMERLSVLSWWATSDQREATTLLVWHLSFPNTHHTADLILFTHHLSPFPLLSFLSSLLNTPMTAFTVLLPLYSCKAHAHTHTHINSACVCLNRSPHCSHQQWHRGGQREVGTTRASQTERRQLLHQLPQLIVSPALRHSINVTDHNEWSLTAGCDCLSLCMSSHKHTHIPVYAQVCVSVLVKMHSLILRFLSSRHCCHGTSA